MTRVIAVIVLIAVMASVVGANPHEGGVASGNDHAHIGAEDVEQSVGVLIPGFAVDGSGDKCWRGFTDTGAQLNTHITYTAIRTDAHDNVWYVDGDCEYMAAPST